MSNAEIDELLRLMNEEAEERWKKAAEEEFKPDIIFRVKMNEAPLVVKESRMILMTSIPRDPEPPYEMDSRYSLDYPSDASDQLGFDILIYRVGPNEYRAMRVDCEHRIAIARTFPMDES